MRRLAATAILVLAVPVLAVPVLAGIMPAVAADIPTRKAGLWELKMSMESLGGLGMTFPRHGFQVNAHLSCSSSSR
jgi:hypothetical protein